MKILTIIIVSFLFLMSSLSFSQDIMKQKNPGNNQTVPGYLISELQKARKQENAVEVKRLEKIIEGYYEKKDYNYLMNDASAPESPSIAEDRWLLNDIIIFNDSLKGSAYNTDLKKGKDGYLYAAVIGKPQSGNKGAIYVYKSPDGGSSWGYVSGIQSPTYYYGQISLLVERDGTTFDSMRVMVYYSASTNTNFDNALIGCMSFRRDGQGWYNCVVAAPPNGYKYLYPSACSDGVFNNAFSYMHVVFVEYYNNNNFTDTLHHSRTIDWGRTHASSKYHTPFSNPQFPSAAMKAYFNYEDDTIYVAVRNYNVISFSNITIMKTTGTPSNNWSNITTYPPGVSTGIKPKLTIVQQNIPPNQKKMFLTFLVTISDTGTGKGAYAYSLGGTSWSAMQYFTSSIIKFANCSSDTNTSSADYIMVAYSNSGDSLMTRRGSYAVLNSPVKVNSSMLSINSFPAPVIYTVGTTKYSSVLYAGQGNFRAYFDGENLITQIKKISAETPDKYFLSQNYPNPFNPVTFINYQLAKSSNVNLKVFDIIGKEIIELINEKQDAGTYEVSFDGTNIPSGIYFYKLTTNEFIKTRKMILVK